MLRPESDRLSLITIFEGVERFAIMFADLANDISIKQKINAPAMIAEVESIRKSIHHEVRNKLVALVQRSKIINEIHHAGR